MLVSRVLIEHLDLFKQDFKNLAKKHIPHKYSMEMRHKSEVVSGIHNVQLLSAM